MKYFLVFIVLILSGCVVYPINKTLQPDAEIIVSDSNGDPVNDAQVFLISNSYPYGFEQRRMRSKTRSTGKAYFPKIKEWRTESLMMHGSEIFFWNWCVVKEGYESHVTSWGSGNDFVTNYKIELEAGKSTLCPDEYN